MPSATSSSIAGLACLLAFAVSQGARDALFGNVFQKVSFLLVAVLAFGASTIVFTGWSLARRPQDVRALTAAPGAFAALNVTNAAAWLSFFLGLRHLEPAVVAALYNGVGPLVALALGALGWTEATTRKSRLEWLCYAAIAAALFALAAVVLTDRSGLTLRHFATEAGALAMCVLGGVMITISHLVARRFNDAGVGSDALMGTRFLATLAAAAVLEVALSDVRSWPPGRQLLQLSLMAFALVVVPAFVLQLGVARASPLAVNVFRALGPVFVFLVQQLDGRLRFSGATLACIAVFCAATIGASVLRAWSETRERRT